MTASTRPVIDRAGAGDLAMRALAAGGVVPEQFGAILLLDGGSGFDVARARALLGERIRAVPRLRRRLVPVPLGCGRPVWADDPFFDLRSHVRHLACPAPGDERALLDLAAQVVTTPLSSLGWSAVFVTGLRGGAVALIIVLDHVLADGIGGLAILSALIDGADLEERPAFPARPPSQARLAADALAERLRALRRLSRSWRDLRAAIDAAWGAPAVPCSLLRPTGPRRRLAVVRADLAAVRAAAHRHGGTVNDALLTVITGALRRLLERRGEHVEALAVTLPVSIGNRTGGDPIGNSIGMLVATLPATGAPGERLAQIAAVLRDRKHLAVGPSAAALLGAVFRLIAWLGLYRRFMRRQRRFHTLVSNVPGPAGRLAFAGAPIRSLTPIAVGESGNVTVSFDALSYAGTLTVTCVADPDRVPDLDDLAALLDAEFALLTTSDQRPSHQGPRSRVPARTPSEAGGESGGGA